jgi:hypothetical protein
MVTNIEIIVLRRLREVCPKKKMSEIDIIEAKKSVKVGFEIINFKPQNFDEAFQKTWESSEVEMLSDFIYAVWRCANGQE